MRSLLRAGGRSPTAEELSKALVTCGQATVARRADNRQAIRTRVRTTQSDLGLLSVTVAETYTRPLGWRSAHRSAADTRESGHSCALGSERAVIAVDSVVVVQERKSKDALEDGV